MAGKGVFGKKIETELPFGISCLKKKGIVTVCDMMAP